MTLLQIQVAMQSVSSLAIAGSLIFAGIQLRNWRRAAYVANFSKMVELQNQLRRIRVDSPELAGVHRHDVEGLTSPRAVQDYFLNLMQLSLFEIAWFSHRQGQLPDDYYNSWVNKMDAIFSEESFRKMIEKPGMKILHDEFVVYVRDMMQKKQSAAGPPPVEAHL